MLDVDALQVEIHIMLISVRRQAAFALLAHAQAGDLVKGTPLLESCQGVVQDHGSYTALEQRQEVLLLYVGDVPRHVVEQDGVEIGSDGTIVNRASFGRLMSARLHFPFRMILEDRPETRVKLMAAGHHEQASARGAASQARRSSHFQHSATAQAVSDHGLRYSFLR